MLMMQVCVVQAELPSLHQHQAKSVSECDADFFGGGFLTQNPPQKKFAPLWSTFLCGADAGSVVLYNHTSHIIIILVQGLFLHHCHKLATPLIEPVPTSHPIVFIAIMAALLCYEGGECERDAHISSHNPKILDSGALRWVPVMQLVALCRASFCITVTGSGPKICSFIAFNDVKSLVLVSCCILEVMRKHMLEKYCFVIVCESSPFYNE